MDEVGTPSRASGVIRLLTALACVAGGTLWSLTPLGIQLSQQKFKTPDVFWKLFPSAPLLLLIGLAGVHFLLSSRYGRLGKAGFFVTLAGLVLTIAGDVGQFWLKLDDAYMITAPAYRSFRLGLLVLAAGSIILGFAALRTGALSRWSALPFLAGSFGVLVAVTKDFEDFGAVLWIAYGICWSWLGLTLLLEAFLSARRKKRGGR